MTTVPYNKLFTDYVTCKKLLNESVGDNKAQIENHIRIIKKHLIGKMFPTVKMIVLGFEVNVGDDVIIVQDGDFGLYCAKHGITLQNPIVLADNYFYSLSDDFLDNI